jgi:hypothetical protein
LGLGLLTSQVFLVFQQGQDFQAAQMGLLGLLSQVIQQGQRDLDCQGYLLHQFFQLDLLLLWHQ